jgi:hypothetical protein
MIMPANYSVIAENELSYVDGGFEFLVDQMTDAKILTKNVVEYIGNSYTSKVLDAFIGTWFANDATSIVSLLKTNVGGLFTRNVDVQGSTAGKVLMGLTNTIGVAAGIYMLGMDDTVIKTYEVKSYALDAKTVQA